VATPPENEARLAPGEQARVDEAVVRVARRGRGPTVVAALVAGAFLVGLVRPWDWLTGGAAAAPAPPAMVAGVERTTPSPHAGAAGAPGASLSVRADGDPASITEAPTCGYPASWRTSTIQLWAGARARVWTAAEAVAAARADDPAIPFNLVASDVVEAIGWCAPVDGPERPPLTAVATLFRLVDGVAMAIEVDRLEPATRDALGELWLPPEESGRPRPLWAPGRYVIRLAGPSGGYERYLGLEVGLPEPTPEPSSARTPEPPVATGSTPAR
jgi:hypothetical protein